MSEQKSAKPLPDSPGKTAAPSLTHPVSPFLLQAEPEPLEIDLQRTAIVVIDMQNSFGSKGGMFDLIGAGTPGQAVIKPIKQITDTARAQGIKVIIAAHVYSSDLSDSGGPNSPSWYKRVHREHREHPERRDSLHFSGRWGAEIIEELKPQEGDIFITKPRYGAFYGTRLDIILKTHDIKFLIFVGVATNICVETSIREAYNLDYFSILISDATMQSGPQMIQEASEFNIKRCFGWVTNTKNIVNALKQKTKN